MVSYDAMQEPRDSETRISLPIARYSLSYLVVPDHSGQQLLEVTWQLRGNFIC